MPYIKHFFLVILFLSVSSLICAQEIVERSQKKRPYWVGQVLENYLITSATAPTLEEAQQKCLNSVKVQILESVAQNIEFSTETIIEQLTHNQDVQSDIIFRQKGKNSVVNLPYVQGVSMANAEEAYWECLEDRNTHERSYMFTLLYPYPYAEYIKLKNEFEKMDSEMVSMVVKIKKALPYVNSVDSVESSIVSLELAKNYFFDAHRKETVDELIHQYKNFLKQLNIESTRIEKCKFRMWLAHDGNVVECSYMPKCKSETATKIQCKIDDESYVVTFSDEYCISDDDNVIDIVFRLEYATLKHKLHF